MDIKLELTREQIELLENNSDVAINGRQKYYFMPLVFERSGESNYFKLHHVDKLPPKVERIINEFK